jgi:dynein heavy chain 2
VLFPSYDDTPDPTQLRTSIKGKNQISARLFLTSILAPLQLVLTVHKMMESISSVLKGTSLLTTPVRQATVSLAAGNVPNKWSDAWEGPESPALWLQAIVHKCASIDRWLDNVPSGSTLSEPLSLSTMFNPSVFLNALRQQVWSRTIP